MAKTNTQADSQQTIPSDGLPVEHILIYDREKALLQALSKIEKDGKLKTVPADDAHNNQFLKLKDSENWLETFFSNLTSQLNDPTKFGIIRIKETDLDDPLVKRAMKDMQEGRITKDVVRFLEKYEVKPQEINDNINTKNTEKMANQDVNATPAPVEDTQPQRRQPFNEKMIDWDNLNSYGLTRESLEQQGVFEKMLNRQKTDELVPIKLESAGTEQRYMARLYLKQENDGHIKLRFETLQKDIQLDRSFMGHTFSEDDKVNLLNIIPDKNTGHNMGRAVPLRQYDGTYVDSLISVDKLTNRLQAVPVDKVYIRNEYSGVKLTDHEKNQLREGKAIWVDSMKSDKNPGQTFGAHLQYNADRRGVEYIFPKNIRLDHGKQIGGVELTRKQVDDFNAGKAIRVDDMVTKDGRLTSSFIKRDELSGKMAFHNYNPDSPEDKREVIIPKEVGGVRTTDEERKALSEGKPIFLNNMTDQHGQDRSSWVKVDLQTGAVRYASDQNGFSEKAAFKIPSELYGVKPTAKQRAEMQDGKAVLIEGMKMNDGSTFSQWARVNKAGNGMEYFTENPDVRKETSLQAGQAHVADPKQDQDNKQSQGRRIR